MSAPDSLPLRRIDHVKFFVGNAKIFPYFKSRLEYCNELYEYLYIIEDMKA